jgi:hypothetical protein
MSRPWETVASTARPWEQGAGANRLISIYREAVTSTAGVQPVQEFNGAQAAPVATNVPCLIEVDRERGRPLGDVPGDIEARTTWRMFIRAGDALAAGLAAAAALRTRDMITDDAGRRFQVAQAFWHSLNGWQLRGELLEA